MLMGAYIKKMQGKLKKTKIVKKEAQSILEYTMLFGIVVTLLAAMTPLMKQGIQGMVKGVADQVGYQQNAEQDASRRSYLVNSATYMDIDHKKRVRERLGTVAYDFDEETQSNAESFSHLGGRPM